MERSHTWKEWKEQENVVDRTVLSSEPQNMAVLGDGALRR